MIDDPPRRGTTGPIAYPAVGDRSPDAISGTVIDDTQTESRPSTGTTAVQATETRSNHSREEHDDHHTGHEGGEDELRFPPALRTMTSTGKPYSSFSRGTKWFIVTLAGIAAVFSPIRYVHPFLHSKSWPIRRTLMSVRISSFPQSRLSPANSIEAKNKSP
jgi:hypothetical protein